MSENKEKEFDLAQVISTAIQIPGVKVVRESFLRETFKDLPSDTIDLIIEKGPIEAGCTRQELLNKANRIIKSRTIFSTSASFVAGIPGGFFMAATIPADLIQFYGVALRMAQELVYLYGEADMWCEGTPDADKVTNQLILYCGVMLGASGAAQMIRIMSSKLAEQILKKLPQQALTKKLYYQVVKMVLKFFGVSVTKSTFAKGVSKVIPVVGGVISGGITFASMLPMGKRLMRALDEAHFDYNENDVKSDIEELSNVYFKDISDECLSEEKSDDSKDILNKIQQAKKMYDDGIITEEEFLEIKLKLISQL